MEVMNERNRRFPDHGYGEFIPVLSYICIQPVVQVGSLRGANWWDRERSDFQPACLKPRFVTLTERYKSGSLGSGARIAEAVFCLGRVTVAYLTVLLTIEGGKYNAKYAVAKFSVGVEEPPV